LTLKLASHEFLKACFTDVFLLRWAKFDHSCEF